ncbi:pilus assembly protein TadG-related protein [Leekyejoonella antrihumi]|uniref:Putative Flp pilus-assembly TadG-like N-terminal domain-containing protein n=1 Tax=Leekyejoonella antrihumi TaxID=1660198 RepID=A0A563E0B4_9MICO|nr:pilus assembly protein TadG-related protein [Leekyejoonella antrihumi]TWP35956.1 hypothetical protein FGL98_12040 [Leekyejoonella antrihumi]
MLRQVGGRRRSATGIDVVRADERQDLMGRGGRGGAGESGQVATGLIICTVLGLLTIMFMVMLPEGSAVNQKSGTQNAADAAALAGADGVIKSIVTDLATLPLSAFAPKTFSCGLGETDAARLAASNNAQLTSYCYDWRADQAVVRVQSIRALSGGQHSQAAALAKTGVPWGECAFSSLPKPTPEPTHTPKPTTSGSPSSKPTSSPTSSAPTGPIHLVCGAITIDYTLGPGGRLVLTDPGALSNLLKARLVG